ncbi:MAG: MAPEG family protein [Pseudomonadales bacterium]
MTVAFWCVLFAGILPLVWVGYAKATGGRYDNRAPRAFLAGIDGAAQRAHWAEQNSYEAFPLFVAGVLIAHFVGAPQGSVDLLAVIFVAARIAHGICYVTDLATARSLAWLIGWISTLALFVVGL